MAVNKVVYNRDGIEETLIDLTSDTVTADKLAKGYTAHNQAGELVTGTMESGGSGGEDIINYFETSTCSSDYFPIPEGTTTLKSYFFQSNSTIYKVNIPTTLVSMVDSAFNGCSYLNSITFSEPSQLTSIPSTCFQNDKKLTSITMPSSLKTIEYGGLMNCTTLATINLNEGLETIGEKAFYYCNALANITLPSTLKSIGYYAFSGGKFTTLTIPETTEQLYLDNPIIYSTSSFTTLVINNSNFTCTGSPIASYCNNFKTVYFNVTPRTISTYLFNSCTAITDIYVPWAEGAVSGAPWGATNATVHYNTTT